MNIDLARAYSEPPPPLDFVAHGILTGTVAILASPGGSGKSWLALQLAHAVAAADVPGADVLGLLPPAASAGPVLYISLEDPAVVLRHRLWTCSFHYKQEILDACIERLTIQDVTTSAIDLAQPTHLAALERACSGMRLVIIDTLSRAHSVDENDNAAMANFLRSLEIVAARTGAAILVLHHTRKGAASDDQEAVRGASAIVNNARCVWYIRRHPNNNIEPDEDMYKGFPVVEIGISKMNYGSPLQPITAVRLVGGFLWPVEAREVVKEKKPRIVV